MGEIVSAITGIFSAIGGGIAALKQVAGSDASKEQYEAVIAELQKRVIEQEQEKKKILFISLAGVAVVVVILVVALRK